MYKQLTSFADSNNITKCHLTHMYAVLQTAEYVFLSAG